MDCDVSEREMRRGATPKYLNATWICLPDTADHLPKALGFCTFRGVSYVYLMGDQDKIKIIVRTEMVETCDLLAARMLSIPRWFCRPIIPTRSVLAYATARSSSR